MSTLSACVSAGAKQSIMARNRSAWTLEAIVLATHQTPGSAVLHRAQVWRNLDVLLMLVLLTLARLNPSAMRSEGKLARKWFIMLLVMALPMP